MVKINVLNDLLEKNVKNKSAIADRLIKSNEVKQHKIELPFPKVIQVETTNICNHGCQFCAYTKMERPKRHINRDTFLRVIKECYELGSREIGLFSGAEPMTCKWLDEYVKLCKDIGYEYTYISTNGALGKTEKYLKVIDAGLDSIKFSVNGGDSETYLKVHGKNDFDKVIQNIKKISNYRKEKKIKLWMGISFVAMSHTKHSFENLKNIIGDQVDEIIMYDANNQSGQVEEFDIDPKMEDCSLPFSKAHFTVEGYMRACCNDYENYLAIDDIKNKKIIDVWNGEIFKKLRSLHLKDKLEGTLCGKCIRNCKGELKPLNEKLVNKNA